MANFDLEISGKFKSTTKGNGDWYYGGGNEAWADIASAKAGVPLAVRNGKTVGVLEANKIVEYIWHNDDLTDNGLVLKTTATTTVVEDVLTSTSAINALSANQGKVLNDGKVDKVTGKGLSTNDYTTSEKNKLAGLLNTTINNTLLSTSIIEALSANQGKVLKDLIDDLTNNIRTETAGETLFQGAICCLKSDGKYWLASNANELNAKSELLVAFENITANNTGKFSSETTISAPNLDTTIGDVLYLGTGGLYIDEPAMLLLGTGSFVRIVGYINKDFVFHFNPDLSFTQIL